MSRLVDRTRMDVLSQALMSELKVRVQENVIDKMVADFKEQATALVKKELENVTLAGVESALSVLKMREELEVRINYGGGDVFSRNVHGV
ncbi:hypothetical protein LCGC14_2195290 [marine sediment metagenome]|uniref:Uncharacterized protein n=1 Tax=marine sediment metagenome TaxID=412755 RepID=A0A0F9GE45_9ZZZZ